MKFSIFLTILLSYSLMAQSEQIPARTLPVPVEGVSKQMQELIAAPYTPVYNTHPKDANEWKTLIETVNQSWDSTLQELKTELKVKVTPTTIAGVKAYIVEPLEIPVKNKNRLLVHVHGGGYVFGGGDATVGEAILLAGIGGYKIISIDYRMPPDHPYPAALDDAIAVWKEAEKMGNPKNMAIFGTSTGGGLTLAMVLRAKADQLPLPAAIAPGTPWADLSETGDSYKANEWVDNVLVTWSGWLGDAAKLYAAGRDLKDPYLSPIYGDFQGFPPAILTTGTRDLFLSNTVRTHRKLRRAGVEAELNVYEGQSHGQYMDDPNIPEVREAFSDIAAFFDKHLDK
jgi:monoterpene epsilon-lactone hydrolase